VCADRGTLGYDGHSARLAAGGLARPKAERNGVGAGGGEGTASLTTVWRGNKDAVGGGAQKGGRGALVWVRKNLEALSRGDRRLVGRKNTVAGASDIILNSKWREGNNGAARIVVVTTTGARAALGWGHGATGGEGEGVAEGRWRSMGAVYKPTTTTHTCRGTEGVRFGGSPSKWVVRAQRSAHHISDPRRLAKIPSESGSSEGRVFS